MSMPARELSSIQRSSMRLNIIPLSNASCISLARFAWTYIIIMTGSVLPLANEKAYVRQTIIIAVLSTWKICLDSAGFMAVQVKAKTNRPHTHYITYYPMSLQSPLELSVNITDYDTFAENEMVDEITIPLSGQLEADSQFGPTKTYSGSCGRASLAVKFRLTSLCPTNQYGPQCDKECIEEPQQTLCNYLGESVDLCPNDNSTDCHCYGNFLEPNCTLCDVNYYPTGECNILCIPQNNSLGNYRCDPVSGDKICLEGYEDPSTFCVNKENNGKLCLP